MSRCARNGTFLNSFALKIQLPRLQNQTPSTTIIPISECGVARNHRTTLLRPRKKEEWKLHYSQGTATVIYSQTDQHHLHKPPRSGLPADLLLVPHQAWPQHQIKTSANVSSCPSSASETNKIRLTCAFGSEVNPRTPGIHRRPRTGKMKSVQRVTIETLRR